MADLEFLSQRDPSKNHEDDQCDAFLQNFELVRRKRTVAQSVGRNLKNVFREGQEPASEDGGPKCSSFEFQMPVPGDCHEAVRKKKEPDSSKQWPVVTHTQQ